jgi:hypothetical protein
MWPYSATFTDTPDVPENTTNFAESLQKVCGCGIYGDVVNRIFTALVCFRKVYGSGNFTEASWIRSQGFALDPPGALGRPPDPLPQIFLSPLTAIPGSAPEGGFFNWGGPRRKNSGSAPVTDPGNFHREGGSIFILVSFCFHLKCFISTLFSQQQWKYNLKKITIGSSSGSANDLVIHVELAVVIFS